MDEAFEAWWANNGEQQGDDWEKDIARRAFEAGYDEALRNSYDGTGVV